MYKFLSRYAGHRLKTPRGTIEFRQNEFVTEDEYDAEYLRKHADFNVIIFEERQPEIACRDCGRTFKTKEALAAHMRFHKQPEQPEAGEG